MPLFYNIITIINMKICNNTDFFSWKKKLHIVNMPFYPKSYWTLKENLLYLTDSTCRQRILHL